MSTEISSHVHDNMLIARDDSGISHSYHPEENI
jgi:hypothetical protein